LGFGGTLAKIKAGSDNKLIISAENQLRKYIKEVYETLPPLRKLLSKRTQKVLDNYFKGKSILENPQKIADLGWNQMLKIKNIGRKSLREISFALYDLSYIEYEDEWLDHYRDEKVSKGEKTK